MKRGIIGHEAAKFTPVTEAAARDLIRRLIAPEGSVVVSGRSPLGGIDVWAEEEAVALKRARIIFPPRTMQWATGYKPRNLAIARAAEVCHVIVVDMYPPTYTGLRFERDGVPYCYHCHASTHLKSGACWTALRAIDMGKTAKWHIIHTDGTILDA